MGDHLMRNLTALGGPYLTPNARPTIRPIWIVETHLDGNRFVVRADEKLTGL